MEVILTAPEGGARHASRATRKGGRETRSRVLDAAAALFMARGFGAVPLAEIAASSDSFPSQVGYYFKTKEALFIEAACRELLHLGAKAEAAAARARDPRGYREALVKTVAPSPVLQLMIEAMALAGRRPELQAMIARTFERLHGEGARAYGDERAKRGWAGRGDARAESQRFWDLAFGIGLRVGSTGGEARAAIAAMMNALGADEPGKDPKR